MMRHSWRCALCSARVLEQLLISVSAIIYDLVLLLVGLVALLELIRNAGGIACQWSRSKRHAR
jgi:hypothetical protein